MIVGYRNRGATGLAVNFTDWIIEGKNGAGSTDLMNLLEKPVFVFWDRQGFLNYYKVDLSSNWLEKRDWEHPGVDIERFRIENGEARSLGKEKDVSCR